MFDYCNKEIYYGFKAFDAYYFISRIYIVLNACICDCFSTATRLLTISKYFSLFLTVRLSVYFVNDTFKEIR